MDGPGVAEVLGLAGLGRIGQEVCRRAQAFDFNFDGLAHYGLVPDFIEDLRRIGTPPAAIDTLFNCAEALLQCWETCRLRAPTIP